MNQINYCKEKDAQVIDSFTYLKRYHSSKNDKKTSSYETQPLTALVCVALT